MNTPSEPDLHVEFIRRERMRLDRILYDPELILNEFHARYNLPDREYRRLAAKDNKVEALLDLLQKKGEKPCKEFISMLRENHEVKITMPALKDLDFSQLDSTSPPPPLGPLSANSTQRAASPQVGPSRGSRARRPHHSQGSTRKPKGPISLKGNLHQVSEIIQNPKSQFFRTQVKTEEKDWSVVVFNTGLQQEFINMEKNKSLVVLKRLKSGWAGTILFTDVSSFEVLNNQLFTGDPPVVVPLVPSDQLLPNKEDCGQGKTSTTSPPCDPQPPLQTVTREILGVRLRDKFSCPNDHLLDNPPASQYVDCEHCDMKYGKEDFKRVLSGKVRVRGPDAVLELTDDHVRSLLKEAMDGGRDTIDQLEIALKEVCFLKVTLNNNTVISVSRASPGASQCRATRIVC